MVVMVVMPVAPPMVMVVVMMVMPVPPPAMMMVMMVGELRFTAGPRFGVLPSSAMSAAKAFGTGSRSSR
jgi:hypothetical protein